MLISAPSWGWIVAANVVLGISQGLTWSTTVIMKMDLVGPERRGLAMGLNEAAGYLARRRYGACHRLHRRHLRAAAGTILLGVAFVAVGLGLSVLTIRETHQPRQGRSRHHVRSRGNRGRLSTREVFTLTSFRDKSLSSVSQAGMVNNLNDGLAWGLFPVLFATAGLGIERIGILAAVYPAVWGAGQLVTGALSDRIGRKWLIVGGMLVQAAAWPWWLLGHGFWIWLAAAILLGAGTAMVYPTLLAAIGDVAHPDWRARSVGIYRLWRDGGFAVGALCPGSPQTRTASRQPWALSRHSPRRPAFWWPCACAARTTAPRPPLPPQPGDPAYEDCFFRNASRASLTSAACVSSRP